MENTSRDELRRRRSVLVAEAERTRRWSRLVRARMDLLAARICPPEVTPGEDLELVPESLPQHLACPDVSAVAALVLGVDGADPAGGTDPVEELHALRAAHRRLLTYQDVLDAAVDRTTTALVVDVVPALAPPQLVLVGAVGDRCHAVVPAGAVDQPWQT